MGEVLDADGHTVCDVYHYDDDIAHADALLIAAAPELLAALEALLPDVHCQCDVAFTSRGKHEPNTLCHHADDVKAAIAKARGGE